MYRYQKDKTMKEKTPQLLLQLFPVICLAFIFTGSLLFSGCSGQPESGTSNPYYQKGLSLRQNNKMKESADAFKKCLRLSPETSEAHFQLATLYEDHLEKPINALYHYSKFLEGESENNENIRVARSSIEQIERELFAKWSRRYPELVEAHSETEEVDRLKTELAKLRNKIDSLHRDRNRLIKQTRDLISKIRDKNAKIAELEE